MSYFKNFKDWALHALVDFQWAHTDARRLQGKLKEGDKVQMNWKCKYSILHRRHYLTFKGLEFTVIKLRNETTDVIVELSPVMRTGSGPLQFISAYWLEPIKQK